MGTLRKVGLAMVEVLWICWIGMVLTLGLVSAVVGLFPWLFIAINPDLSIVFAQLGAPRLALLGFGGAYLVGFTLHRICRGG